LGSVILTWLIILGLVGLNLNLSLSRT
jgi:hypothetical protein